MMQLKYRGIAYQATFIDDHASEAMQSCVRQRQVATQSQSIQARLRKPRQELIYRGIRYCR